MSRVADAAHITYLESNNDYKLCKCYRIVPKGGTAVGFTDHDKDLTIDLGDAHGPILYQADTVIRSSELQNKTSMGASNVDVEMVLLQANSLSVEEVMLGQYDNAELDIFEARWDLATPTVMRGFCGLLSNARVEDDKIEVTYRSFAGLYDQTILRTIRRGCHYELGLNNFGWHRCYVQMEAPTWTASTAYTTRDPFDAKTEIGGIVKPSSANGFWYIATVGGTSGGSEPTWPGTLGGTVTDNDITWTAIYSRRFDGVVGVVGSNQNFLDVNNAIGADYWRFGYLIWNTGNNAGKRVEIDTDDGAGNIRLFHKMKQDIQVGDTYSIYAGCDHFKSTCKNKFDNIFWFGGFDDAPGVLVLTKAPGGDW